MFLPSFFLTNHWNWGHGGEVQGAFGEEVSRSQGLSTLQALVMSLALLLVCGTPGKDLEEVELGIGLWFVQGQVQPAVAVWTRQVTLRLQGRKQSGLLPGPGVSG